MNLTIFKPLLKELIKFYIEELDHPTGGYLHVILDDGNTDAASIRYCLSECQLYGDSFGIFLARLMREFTEDELRGMYEGDWQ